MDTVFSHELVSVIKRACFARQTEAVRPTLLIIDHGVQEELLTQVIQELALDSTLSVAKIVLDDAVLFERALMRATVVLTFSVLPQTVAQTLFLSKKPVLEWALVKRNACPLFWPAHSIMDFFIVHQDSLVTSSIRSVSQEGEEQ